jgi:signal transduction histidine kinase
MLDALATQAAIAIQNARQYEELKQTRGLVGSRTALAWMGMASSTWRHTIDKHALSIAEQIDLLRTELVSEIPTSDHPHVYERLGRIQRLARQIAEKRITPPLSAEEGVVSVSINGLIKERIKQLRETEPYRSVEFQLNLALADGKTVRASPEWLRRALDILIDNSVEAVSHSSDQKIMIETGQQDNQIVICVTDTGHGIPEEIRSQLFHNPIEKAKGSKGLGMGLLMAEAIIQTYGGEIGMESTGASGTTMFVRLPVEF